MPKAGAAGIQTTELLKICDDRLSAGIVTFSFPDFLAAIPL
jgi:hypothetical protein